jgi:hypothetical protein
MNKFIIGLLVYLVISLIVHFVMLIYDHNLKIHSNHGFYPKFRTFLNLLCVLWFLMFNIFSWDSTINEWLYKIDRNRILRKKKEQERINERAAPLEYSAEELKKSWILAESGTYSVNGKNIQIKELKERLASGSISEPRKCPKCHHISIYNIKGYDGIIKEYYSDGNSLFAITRVTTLCIYCGHYEGDNIWLA